MLVRDGAIERIARSAATRTSSWRSTRPPTAAPGHSAANRYGLEPGAPADLVVVAARTAAEAVVTHPRRELVLKDGRVVARDGRLQ